MKIAQIQMHVSADKSENIRHACELVRSAGEIAEAPPVADEARRFRGSAPVGWHDGGQETEAPTALSVTFGDSSPRGRAK